MKNVAARNGLIVLAASAVFYEFCIRPVASCRASASLVVI